MPPRDLDRRIFVQRFGSVYEHSPWIAEALADAGLGARHDTVIGLASALAEIVDAAGRPALLALIRAHPDLGARAEIGGGLTTESSAEQASAGLDRCTPREYQRLQALNAAYREQFGFPFVMAVRGRSRAEILDAMEARLRNDPDTEFATAIAQIHAIARLRLEAIAASEAER